MENNSKLYHPSMITPIRVAIAVTTTSTATTTL